MRWLGNIMSNPVLFYSFIALFFAGTFFLGALIYMDRKNLKSFNEEEKRLLNEFHSLSSEEEPEEVKITQITEKQEERPKANLEEVLEQMQANLEKKEDVVSLFEQEQEEKAIISYQELLQSKNKNITGANKELLSAIEKIESVGVEQEQEKEPELDYFDMMEKEPILATKTEEKSFKTTDFISPIYGKLDSHIEYPKIPNFNNLSETRMSRNSIEVEQKANRLEETGTSSNDAFLNALKEFRSHLE